MVHNGSPSLHAILEESPVRMTWPRAMEGTSMLQTIPAVPQWTVVPQLDTEPLREQLMAYQEERRCAVQDDTARGATQRWGEVTGEQATVEDRLTDLDQRESVLEVDQAATTNREERKLPTFARTSQNVAAAAALLDTLPTSSTDGVGKVYQYLQSILATAIAQPVECSLQH
jgi:hypothetical protein